MILAPLSEATLLGQFAPSPSITGRVEDSQGRPLVGVSIRLLPRPPLTVAVGSPEVQSSPAGAYRFDSLTPGPYELCAAAPAIGYLDTCVWSTIAPGDRAITVGAGQQRVLPAIRLSPGVRLRLEVLDVNGVLERDESPQTGESGPNPDQSVVANTQVAKTTFNAIAELINSHCGGGVRGFVPNICNALFMLGETSAWKPDPATHFNCDGSPKNAPLGTSQAFNQSALPARASGSVYRYWVDGANPPPGGGPACYGLPHHVSQVALPSP